MYPVVRFEKVTPGIKGTLDRVVDESLLTSPVGGRGIFATPAQIGLMGGGSHRPAADPLPDGHPPVGFAGTQPCARADPR
mgnify:CR=1 FL=1